MQKFLAIDAGGTSTRAVLVDPAGYCHGYGTAGGGNPVSRGFGPALDALVQASTLALGGRPAAIEGVLVAMAGASLELPLHLFQAGFKPLGLAGNVMIETDLLAMFYSGSCHDEGLALIAGTGAVGARIAGSQLAAVADGTGWLLGDKGSGFWLGREIAQAVAAALDGRGKATALTELVLAELGIAWEPHARTQGRLRAQQQLISRVYEQSPIELSRFTPLVFTVQEDDVARDIIERAANALAKTLLAVSLGVESDGAARIAARPLVFGGSVLTKGSTVAQAVVDTLTANNSEPGSGINTAITPILVDDGVAGSAVLVLKRHGIDVDAGVFSRIQDSLAALRS
ncbi:N-acetylglucosamine kinase [Arthrobacter sp.]|uniref:N-acetylglucosamine kinase n=1 Tax=Arthrobacter sp. TaxID=1667 RepID=UPI0026E0C98D|nr:BadF/BadG/BcrA/BcrD ATPase family protein [Arthrobacter sp.]MDO5754075.1 BadF/BadG/BcrA/BcrD ATPase family protein [Arthrobacter sp.]